jgi:hypothetical protein
LYFKKENEPEVSNEEANNGTEENKDDNEVSGN